MASDLSSLVHPKEPRYRAIAIVASAFGYVALASAVVLAGEARPVLLTYAVGIGAFLVMTNGLLIGHLRGNGIRVSARQLPELHALAERHAERLDMAMPDVFVLQAGGALNAFATRFLGRDFVVLYSDVVELAQAEGEPALSFVIGHELGHLKRRHLTWRLALLPSRFVPFLGSAYARACEYTCDRFGAYCAPEAGASGLLVLSAGKTLYRRVDVDAFAAQAQSEAGFWTRLAELLASHPTLAKRVAALRAHAPRASGVPSYASRYSAPAFQPAVGETFGARG